MAPCHGNKLSSYIKQVVEAGIPVVTFDTDAPLNSSRTACVGTDNHFMGVTMANVLKQLRPEGGTFGIVTAQDKPNLDARLAGFMEEISRDNANDEKAHWDQIKGSPLTGINGDILQAQVLADLNPTAIVVLFQSPMRSVNWTDWIDFNRERDITVVVRRSQVKALVDGHRTEKMLECFLRILSPF
jgi:DNA-binding LacI/PurR family transcriptional regulator